MELRHIRYFIAVAEALNFTRAAARLHTAQPSLSQQIRDLEGEIGTPLLIRTKRSVKLTAAGQAFLQEARLVLAQAERAVMLARQAGDVHADEFSIGFVPSAEVRVFPHVLPMMRAQYPELTLNFHSLTTAEQIRALLQKKIDIAFLRPPVTHPELSHESIISESLVLVMPANHPLARQARIHPSQLTDTDFIHINAQHAGQRLHDAIQSWLQRHGLTQQVTQEVHNVLSLLSLISMGQGISLLPNYAEQMLFRNIVTRPLDDDSLPEIPLLMAWRREDEHVPMHRFMRELVHDIFNNPPLSAGLT